MLSNQTLTTTSGNELNRSRKRAHESVTNSRPKRHQVTSSNGSLKASYLVSPFHELTLFDEEIEKINVKDVVGQEFIDRIGKLYKPVLMEQNSKQLSMNERLTLIDVSRNTVKRSIQKHECSNNRNSLIEYDIVSLFQDEMLNHCSEELLLPFSNIEDNVMGLAVIYLGEAFSNNESLSRTLCEYINTMLNKTVQNVLYDTDSEYYGSDTCVGNFHTQKKKRT